MYYFVVNPAARSGHGMDVWEQVRPVLDDKGVEYSHVCSAAKGEVETLVRSITTEHADQAPIKLIILGGDGTLNEAMQGIADFDKVQLGYIPAGSANDFAANTGVSKAPLEALEQILACETPTSFDLGYMTYDDSENAEKRHYFTSSCGIGYDAAVSRASMLPSASKNILNKLGMGDSIYLLMAVKTLVSLKRGDLVMTLDDKEVISLTNFLFVCSMIYRYEGGGFLFSPDADPTDGALDICVFGKIPKWKVLFAFPAAYKGTHYKFKDVEPRRASKVHIRATMPFWIQLDGEVETQSAEITVHCGRQQLKLLK